MVRCLQGNKVTSLAFIFLHQEAPRNTQEPHGDIFLCVCVFACVRVCVCVCVVCLSYLVTQFFFFVQRLSVLTNFSILSYNKYIINKYPLSDITTLLL